MLVLFPSALVTALEGWTIERMAELSDKFSTLNPFSLEHADFFTIFAGSHQLALDTEGRVALPEELIEFANITESAAFVGLGDKMQVWEPTAFEAHLAAARERKRQELQIQKARAEAAAAS
jgi:MraZ protein